MNDKTLVICEKDKIRIRDLIVTALVGIPTDTLQRITEQVMDLPGWDKSTVTDQAFKDALTTVIRDAAQEWAKVHKEAIRAAVLKALDNNQDRLLEQLTNNVESYFMNFSFSLRVLQKT